MPKLIRKAMNAQHVNIIIEIGMTHKYVNINNILFKYMDFELNYQYN